MCFFGPLEFFYINIYMLTMTSLCSSIKIIHLKFGEKVSLPCVRLCSANKKFAELIVKLVKNILTITANK